MEETNASILEVAEHQASWLCSRVWMSFVWRRAVKPLYTTEVGDLPAATSPLFGRQGDALGVVVGKLTKKKSTARAHVQ
jgi:hypothetical protein